MSLTITPYSAQTVISFYSALNLLREKQKVMLGPHVLQMAEILRKTAGAEGECKHIGVFIRMLEAAIANDKSGFPIRSLRSNAQRVLREGEAKEVRAWALEAIKALLASLPAGNASSVFDPGPPAIGGKFKVLKFVSVKPPVIQITTSLREKQGRSTEMAVDKERQGSPAVTPSPSQVRMSNPVGSEREPPCGYADLQNPPIFSSPVPSNKLTATLIVRNRPATVTSRTNTGRRVTETIGTDFTFMFVSHVTIPPEDRFALARLLEEALQTTIPNTDKTGYVQHSGETLTNIAMTVFSLGKADRRGNIERLAKALVEHLNNNGHQVTLEFNK
jgi:hypothetical protein